MHPATTVVITMAGFGSRFRDAGYQQPKYMIEANGATLFDWSMRGLQAFIDQGSPFLFVVRRADQGADFIRARAKANGIDDVQVIELDQPTDGQATTARLACDHLEPDTPVAIFNIDTGVQPYLLKPVQASGDGWIPCFRAPGEAWSFVRTDEACRALEVREKKRISELATIGFYWFSSAALYCNAYDTYYSCAGREERGERYVAPVYNQLIAEGRDVMVTELDFASVTPLGTPKEVETFIALNRTT
ncbi:glycosyltransferase family 2 protein [Geomonas anaerohicana]|uniref:Glycosyltransferase family 2 protein n=1 Tax=Geomonas anaerohicana TaxID=2798583 RepID=A0ABS0YGP5_9BACT|nr:glycosyltransferase family 2 protein [Geomonas anaerohicana]MBJ6751470.1 glycosyltransferase family 2 protein [Geomonas anaerohicana]